MKRFSVLYLLNERHYHIGCANISETKAALDKLATDKKRVPIGVYDDKTELFDWEPIRQRDYNQAGIEEQGKQGEQIIAIAQTLRRRDTSWQKAGEFQRPSFFA